MTTCTIWVSLYGIENKPWFNFIGGGGGKRPPSPPPHQYASGDQKKACGHDNLPVKLLVDSAQYISNPLSYIFNLSLQLGQFPDPLKIAKVSPVYKKGDREQPGNYRPISVLSVLSKIFEKFVNNSLIEYLKKHNILYKHQYGFREGHSTKLAVTNLINQLVHYQEGYLLTGFEIICVKEYSTFNIMVPYLHSN